jgi:tRNA pseudouridine55 synthase
VKLARGNEAGQHGAVLHGWIILDKPVGLGSTTAVSAVKRILRQAGEPKTKVGHGGTLDPLASGVLPVALGEATKLCGRMLDASKGYEFTIAFGVETDTLDAEGDAVATSEVRPTREQIETALPGFAGEIEQVPPAFSALKLGGKPAYARARAGEAVEMRSRAVTVHELRIEEENPHPGLLPHAGEGEERGARREPSPACGRGLGEGFPSSSLDSITLSANVSKGTYIRSLGRDIAHALGTVGYVSYLRRTRAGPFSVDQAISLDFLEEAAKARQLTRTVLPLTAALDDIPALPVTPDQARLLRHGQMLFGFPAQPGLRMAMLEETPVALVEASADGLKVVRGFNL